MQVSAADLCIRTTRAKQTRTTFLSHLGTLPPCSPLKCTLIINTVIAEDRDSRKIVAPKNCPEKKYVVVEAFRSKVTTANLRVFLSITLNTIQSILLGKKTSVVMCHNLNPPFCATQMETEVALFHGKNSIYVTL